MSVNLPEIPSWREFHKVKAALNDSKLTESKNKKRAKLEMDNISNLANLASNAKPANNFDWNSIGDGKPTGAEPDNKSFIEKALETPVGQGILDVLNVGTYSSAAMADSIRQSFNKGAADGNVGAMVGEFANQQINHNPIVMGVKGAFGDTDSQRTYAHVIKEAQKDAGFDTENDAAKIGQGVGGFAGDVLLDPLTYLSLGTGSLIKGASKGLREGAKISKEAAKEAVEKQKNLAARSGVAESSTVDPALEKIANNPSNRYATAFREAGAAWKADPNKGFIFKNNKLAKENRKGRGEDLTHEESLIGLRDIGEGKSVSKAEAVQRNIDQRAAEADKAYQARHKAEVEAKIAALDADIPKKAIDSTDSATPAEAVAKAREDIVKVLDAPNPKKVIEENTVAPKPKPVVVDEVLEKQRKTDNAIRTLEPNWFSAKSADEVAPIKVAGKATNANIYQKLWDDAVRSNNTPLVIKQGGKYVKVRAREVIKAKGLKSPADFAKIDIHPEFIKSISDSIVSDQASTVANMMKETAPKVKSNAQIRADWNSDRLPRSARNQIREITGVVDNDAMAIEKFINMRKEMLARSRSQEAAISKAEKRKADLENNPNPVKPQNEDVAKTAEQNEELLRKFDEDPDTTEFAVSAQARAEKYDEALKAPVDPGSTIDRELRNNIAHEAVKKSLVNQTKGAKYKTNKDWRTLTENVNTGGAWKPERWGSNSQQAMHSHILGSLGKVRFENKFTAYMDILKVADAELKAIGIEPFMDFTKIGKQKHLNLSAYDMFKNISSISPNFEKTLSRMLFGYPGERVQFTQIQGAVEMMMRGKMAGKSVQDLESKVKDYLLSNKNSREHGYPLNNQVAGEKFIQKPGKVQDRKVSTEGYVDVLMDPRVFDNLVTQSTINHMMHASTVAKNVEEVTKNTLARVFETIDSATPADASAKLFHEYRNLGKNFAPEDLATAKNLFMKNIESEVRPAELKTIGNSEKRVAKASAPETSASRAEINSTHRNDAEVSAKESAETMPETAEAFEYMAGAISDAAWKKIHPVQQFVNPRLGLDGEVYRTINSGMHSIARQQNEFQSSILDYIAKYSGEELLSSWTQIRHLAAKNGENLFEVDMKAMSPATQDLYSVISHVMNTSAQNIWSRNGVGANHFNALADAAHLNKNWRFDPSASMNQNATKWAREWEGVEDTGVINFLSKMHSVALKASQEISIAADFSFRFGSKTKGPGMVKMVWSNKGSKDSSFFDLIDQGLYYPKDIAAQVHKVNQLITESRGVSTKTLFGKFIVDTFDPVTNALKASMTTVRPGHWAVSVGGDLLRNQLAGVNSIVPYKNAVKVLTSGKKTFNGADSAVGDISAFKELGNYRRVQKTANGFEGTSAGGGTNFHIGGKKTHVSYETLYRMGNDGINIPPHAAGGAVEDRLIEDIGKTSGRFGKFLNKATDVVTDNKHFSLNSMASGRDNVMRWALALDYASKRKWKNLEEMKRGMEDFVTKWAPISTDMTKFEAKNVRRTILFYTWLRGITPRIIDSAMSNPGVTTMVPKALYNTAYANGLNPESIGNPFPEDGQFPDYYKDGILGPQWKDGMDHYWGLNPASPIIDVANTFQDFKLGDPVNSSLKVGENMLGMTTPFFKLPIEMMTGSNLQNGVPIKDKAQYLLDNLGGSYISTASRATGKTIGPNGILNRTDNAHKNSPEEQAEHAKLQLINFLLGTKITDYTSDGARRGANYQRRQEYKDKNELERRRD